MRPRLNRHKLLLVIVMAIVARLVVLLALPDVFDFSGGDIHGSAAYDDYARNLLETGVYGRESGQPDSILPPLYSYVLAGVYRLFGRHYIAVGLAHIFFDALSIALLHDIARRLFPRPSGEWIGLLAALFFAFYPYLIFQNLTLSDTSLWILLLHLFLWLMILLRERAAFDRMTMGIALVGGLALGLATLTRALLMPLLPLTALWFLFRLDWRQTLRCLLPVALICTLALLPWLMRGDQIYGGFVAIALNSGENFYQGNNPQTIPFFRAGYDVQWSSPPADLPPTENRYHRNHALMAAGWRYLRENPQRIPELLLVKFQVYWNARVTPLNNLRQGERLRLENGEALLLADEGSHTGVTAANAAYQTDSLFQVIGRRVHILYFGGLWLLAIVGAWLCRREWRMVSLLVFVQLSQTAMYLIFHPSTRYRSPTDPLLFVFSAYALVWGAAWWRARTQSQ